MSESEYSRFPSVNYSDGKVTFVVSSYNRWNMLQQCLDSFIINVNQDLIERFLIVEDSMNKDIANNIINKYGNKVDLIFNSKRVGQAPSLDRAYRTVHTQFIMHCEDDYEWRGGPDILRDSIDILTERKDTHKIWCRHFEDYLIDQGQDQFEEEIQQTSTGIPYKMLKVRDWCGFTFNPGLIRTEDYIKMFPEGYGKHRTIHWQYSGVQTEATCNVSAKSQGFRGALCLRGACYNRGLKCPTYK
jgi:hypothetical protein